jgi:acetolactate synthase I/II/III large subunit
MSAEEQVAREIGSALAEAGTQYLFGVPGGGANLGLIDACQQEGLRFVLCHGETAGAMMASAYAELTGRPGACLATRGPGAASLANGVAHAWLDRCPLLAVTDVVGAELRARISHQRLDQRSLLGATAKASWTVGAGGGEPVTTALAHAMSPPWGPVHIDVDPKSASSIDPLPTVSGCPDFAGSLERARRAVSTARRPVVVAGVGCRGAEQHVAAFVAEHGLPVLTTYKAKGAVDEFSSHAAGLLTGATIEAPVLDAADLILAVGLDPVELIPAPWPYAAPVVALGPWITDDAYFDPCASFLADVPDALAMLAGCIDGSGWRTSGRQFRQRARETLLRSGGSGGLSAQDVVLDAREAFSADTIATVDSGAHMLVAMELWDVAEPRCALISSGLASMGFALPAAIAAGLLSATRRVVCFTGDGGLGMCLAELETLARLNLPVTVIVLDDAGLSLIAAKQRPGADGGANAVRYSQVDFAELARSCGLPATRVSDRSALRGALAQAAGTGGPMLVDAVVDPSGYPAVLDAIRGE